jgi:hypothetical protein
VSAADYKKYSFYACTSIYGVGQFYFEKKSVNKVSGLTQKGDCDTIAPD